MIYIAQMYKIKCVTIMYVATKNKTRGPQALTVTWVSETTLISCQKGSYLYINIPIIE